MTIGAFPVFSIYCAFISDCMFFVVVLIGHFLKNNPNFSFNKTNQKFANKIILFESVAKGWWKPTFFQMAFYTP